VFLVTFAVAIFPQSKKNRQTGNFTVLRDIGAPSFREVNTAGRLAQSFSDLTRKNIDLSAVTVITPQLTETAESRS
jgi:hypothetical protein